MCGVLCRRHGFILTRMSQKSIYVLSKTNCDKFKLNKRQFELLLVAVKDANNQRASIVPTLSSDGTTIGILYIPTMFANILMHNELYTKQSMLLLY